MIATDLKTGKIFKEDGFPFRVDKYSFSKVARGGATVRVKARNLLTGQVIEKSYNGNTKVEEADMSRRVVSYLYEDNGYVFMDPATYEQFTIPRDIVGDTSYYLVPGGEVSVLSFENKPIAVEVANTIILEVTYTEPGYKGNTVTNTLKDATMSNNMSVRVPTFIKIGDKIKVDTRTGEYISKA